MNEIRQWRLPLLLALLLLAAQVWLFWPFLRLATPLDEEWALIDAATMQSPLSWLTQGYSQFFIAYPEWDHPGTNLLRPLASLLYALVYGLGGGQALLLALAYAAHALAVAVVGHAIRQHLGLAPALAALALLVAALSPAWLSIPVGYRVAPGLQYPIYGAEIWCGLLMLLAFMCLLRGALSGYVALAVLAVMMKETALPLPLAALCCTGLWWQPGQPRRNATTALLLLSPLLLWLFIRLAVFAPTGLGINVLEDGSLKTLLAKPLKAALIWPTTLFRDAPGHLASRPQAEGLVPVLPALAALALNLLFWILLVTPLGRAASRARAWRWQGWLAFSRDPAVALLILAFSNLGFVLLVDSLELRYGYLFTLVGPAAILALAARAALIRTLPLALIYLAVVAMGLADIRANRAPEALNSHARMRAAATDLVRLVQQLPAGTSRIYLVNDWSIGFSGTESFARVAKAAAPLTRINDITDTGHPPCTAGQWNEGHTRISRSGGEVLVDMVPPPCFDLWFHSGNVMLTIPVDASNQAWRGPLHYTLPELDALPPGLLSRQRRQLPGRHLKVSLPYDEKAAWVVFDFTQQRYNLVPASQLLVKPLP